MTVKSLKQAAFEQWGLFLRQRYRSGPRRQESCRNCLIAIESITKQKPTSGRKIVGSVAEGMISILYCESPQAVSRSTPPQKWRMAARGKAGGRREEAAQGQTGDAESQGRQLHKDWHGAAAGRRWGGADGVKSGEGTGFKFNCKSWSASWGDEDKSAGWLRLEPTEGEVLSKLRETLITAQETNKNLFIF